MPCDFDKTVLPSTCSSCGWWNPTFGNSKDHVWTAGQCRRHAPVFYRMSNYYTTSDKVWPSTLPDDFCGDWEGLEYSNLEKRNARLKEEKPQ